MAIKNFIFSLKWHTKNFRFNIKNMFKKKYTCKFCLTKITNDKQVNNKPFAKYWDNVCEDCAFYLEDMTEMSII